VPEAAAVTLEAISRSTLFADDRNSAAAPAYWLANLHATLDQRSAGWRFSESARIDNLTGRRYVGSVIVNATNAQYFEPAPGRAFYLTLHVQH
jgi:iron complex outermembrane receptor protein